jgi:hypothetical protein
MNKKKPDYTKFMRKPPSLRMNQSSEAESRQTTSRPVREEEIPWAEIVEECDDPFSECTGPVHPPIIVEDEDASRTTAHRYARRSSARLGTALTPSSLWKTASLAGPPGLPLPAFLIVLVLLYLMT